MIKQSCQALVGGAIISFSFTANTMPVQAESRTAQCLRFNQAMTTFQRQLASVKQHNRSTNRQNPVKNIDQWLKVSESSLKQLQKRQFNDPKIRAFQQRALNLYVDIHNRMIGIADAVEAQDRQAAMQSYAKLFGAIKPEMQLKQQFRAYCSR